jgi:hypothetical protein
MLLRRCVLREPNIVAFMFELFSDFIFEKCTRPRHGSSMKVAFVRCPDGRTDGRTDRYGSARRAAPVARRPSLARPCASCQLHAAPLPGCCRGGGGGGVRALVHWALATFPCGLSEAQQTPPAALLPTMPAPSDRDQCSSGNLGFAVHTVPREGRAALLANPPTCGGGHGWRSRRPRVCDSSLASHSSVPRSVFCCQQSGQGRGCGAHGSRRSCATSISQAKR